MTDRPNNILKRGDKGRITESTGRKIKYSEQDIAVITKRICDVIRTGNYLTTSAKVVGLNESTFWHFYKQGKKGNPRFTTFYDEVTKAEAEAEVVAVMHVRNAMQDNWVAAMTFLERKFPEKWARRESLHVEGGIDVAVTNKQPVVNIHVTPEAKRLSDEVNSQPIVDAEIIEEKIHTR